MKAKGLLPFALLGLALRLAFGLAYWTNQPLTRDEREYLSLARSLAAGQGFSYDPELSTATAPPFDRAPGYPAFLALVGGGAAPAASVPASVKIAQSCLGACGVMLIGVLASRLAGPAAGRAAAFIAACYPPLVWIAGYALSEALIWPVGLGLVWLFDRAAAPGQMPRPIWALLSGAAAGASALIRPAMLLFALLAAFWLLLSRRSAAAAALFTIGVVAIVLPWTIRNYEREHRVVVIAAEGGVTFWTGNHPLAIGEGDLAANPALKRASLELRARHPELSEPQMEAVYYEEALAWIRAHPWQSLTLEIRKIFYLIVPVGPSYRLHSVRYYAASLISYLVVLPPAAIGFWLLGRARRNSPGLWLLTASAIATALIFFPQERFRIPIIDPALIICAGACAGARAIET